MKKIYAVVLSALLSLSLAGCQQPEASTQKGPADSSLCANTSAYLMAETEGGFYYSTGNILYYAGGIALAFIFKDNRAFCKYLCPITVFLKPMSYFSLLRVHCDESKCVQCGKCLKVCPMNVEVNKESRKRKNATECILCYACTKVCPKKALH